MSCSVGKSYGTGFASLNAGTAATTSIVELVGSATKKIRLLLVSVGGIEATALATNDLRLVKQSTASTGGTKTSPTPTPFDSEFPAATAVLNGYTVAPVQGTIVGIIAVAKLSLVLATTITAPPILFDFRGLPASQRPTLHTAAECLTVDLAGATPANAPSLDIYFWWTEQPLNSAN
jgi:hypothetical protein